jgi:5-methylcytosine-specific restriction endonuclease McrA
LRRFHRSKPADMPALYKWDKGDAAIRLSEESHSFLRQSAATLEVVANYHWAEYLEACNRLAPRIIQKISRNGAKRGPLTKYLRILLADGEGACFYCDDRFSNENRAVVDHVIPWSFLLDDPLWDMVLACASCNGAKSDWLPSTEYVERLITRNARELRLRVGKNVSLLAGSDDAQRFFEAAISVEWPGFWRPNL